MTIARLPLTDNSPLLRTDFTDDAAWQALVDEVDDGWVTVAVDPGHPGLSVTELLGLVPEGRHYPLLVVADEVTFSSAERPLLLIDVADRPGRTFRAVPDACRSAVGNLAIDNQCFDDYLGSGSLDGSGIYRLADRHRQALTELRSGQRPSS